MPKKRNCKIKTIKTIPHPLKSLFVLKEYKIIPKAAAIVKIILATTISKEYCNVIDADIIDSERVTKNNKI